MENNLTIVKDQFKELPNNIEAEQAVIGSILVTNEIFDEINTIISHINFYDPMHQKIFNAIENQIYKGMLANPITLKNFFKDEKDDLNVPEYLVKVTKFSTPPRQAIEYSRIIYDMFVRRELIKISENTIDAAKLNALDVNGQNIIENSERLLFDLAEKGSFNSSLIKFDEAMKQTIEMASAAYKNDEGIVGVPTGLRDLDDRLGGLHNSDLIIIAGRPSMGKTALATNIAFNAAQKLQESGKKSAVAFFSLEMSSEQLSTRILAEQSRIVRLPLNKIGSINKINKTYAFLEQAHERAPSAEEIAKELDMTVNDVKESLKNSGRHVSMDAPLVEGEDSNLYDVLNSGESPNPDRQLLHESLRTEIERALDTLTPREADVVRLYFGLGNQHAMTLEEIGETFDLTRERVRQIKEKAIRRLKHTSRSKILKTYLG